MSRKLNRGIKKEEWKVTGGRDKETSRLMETRFLAVSVIVIIIIIIIIIIKAC
jgi:hypothetical protein